MKKLIVIGLVLLLLGGGGAVGAMAFGLLPDVFGLFGGGSGHQAEAKTETVRDRLGPPPFLLTMKPIEIPVILNGQIRTRANFRFRLHADPDMVVRLQTEGHLLHSAMFKDLMVYLPRQMEQGGDIDLLAVKHRMRRIAQTMMGADVIKDVLIQSYYER